MAESPLLHLRVEHVPARESDCLGSLLLHRRHHSGQVGGRVEVVVVKVGQQLAGGDMRADVPLCANAPVMPGLALELQVDKARVLFCHLLQETGALVHVGLDHDELLVLPTLGHKAAPELLVEVLPGLRCWGDHGDAALLALAAGDGTARLALRRSAPLRGARLRGAGLRRLPGVESALRAEPEHALALVPVDRLGRQLGEIFALKGLLRLLGALVEDLLRLHEDVAGVLAAAPPAAALLKGVGVPRKRDVGRAGAELAVPAHAPQGVEAADVRLVRLLRQG
mmetsp:Transcript_11327/g.30906  ORF Transcript_11327/g.30906 Transcript_11327/m.30906 type:complete len:282 (+) Transcript_11327:1665-2510(+)